MASNYYEANGVLVLDRVTPVIRALFCGFQLDADYPGNGEAYIAVDAGTPPSWKDLCEALVNLARPLGFIPSPGTPNPFGEVLQVLGKHFCADGNAALASMIERDRLRDAANLKDLFLLATCFDDGHHLREIRFDGCWRCDKPRLLEIGGTAHYVSWEFEACGVSTAALHLGSTIRKALSSKDFDAAGSAVARDTLRLLAGIRDVAHRDKVQRATIWKLMEDLVDQGER